MKKAGRTVSLFVDKAVLGRSTHSSQACMDCHQGLNPNETPHAELIQPVYCQSCHDVPGYEQSIHGTPRQGKGRKSVSSAAACKDCHGTHDILSPSDPKSPTNRSRLESSCGRCHQNEESHYLRSAHGEALQKGVQGAPSCVDCHGAHDTGSTASKDSPLYKTHEAMTCLKCHLNNPDVRQQMVPSAGFVAAYESSVHGMALASGNEKAATCSDCHGAHDMKRGNDPTSRVSRWNIPQTCAKCHADISKTYDESIHGTALQMGNRDAPSCIDCHGEHQILALKDPRSRVAAQNISTEVCAPCHSSVLLTQKYGLPGERFKTFADSYHGLASKGGSVQVANCASCHGVHNIKPSSDPTSTISKANLAATCGHCHPGANQNFTKGPVHLVVSSQEGKIIYWIRNFYVTLIVVLIGGMSLHNLLDFLRKSRLQLAARQGKIPLEHFGAIQYVRMTLSERIQHWVLLASFIVLVITGFMLKFPDAWWVVPIRQLSEKVFEVRSIAHRVAAVLMILISLYHLCYILFTLRGKKLIRDFLPKLQDVREVWALTLYNAGFSKSNPKFGRFSYIEKAEYWALVWGMVVMAGTGFIMWFDNFFIRLFTKLGWDVARTIHYYEAVLATLAIIVWHFYFVIFNPDVYPINTAWWTGKISEVEMAVEHPLELEEIQSAELRKLDKESLSEPTADDSKPASS